MTFTTTTTTATMLRAHATPPVEVPDGSGTGRSLPSSLLILATLCSLFATLLSLTSIYTHLKNYRKPHLQRFVVRLILIVPIYATSSAIGLFSLPAAFLIDLIRDLYEAFAIYCFFELLVAYLGGERSVLVLMIGRRPIRHPWPFCIFLREMDMSDPYTFLAIKRGILQYVQIKPILAVSTVVLKSFGRYEEGELKAGNGYTYVSTVYNISIFLSLYCLAIFWQASSSELEPFRPTSKFLTVKGVVFATFWQGWAISVLVAAGLVKSIGPISDPSFLRLGLQELLLCLEMPLFALGHMYAFSAKDYVDSWATHQARLPIIYALRDALGGRDVLEDSLTTIRGTGYGYQTFEPSQGAVHQGLARSRRLHAGLRYTAGGKGKYFLPTRAAPHANGPWAAEGTRLQGPLAAMRRWMEDRRMKEGGFAPMTDEEEAGVVHVAPEGEEQPHDVGEGTADEQTRKQRAATAALKVGHTLESSLRFFTASADGAQPQGNSGAGVGGDGGDSVSLGFHTPRSHGSEENLYGRARDLEHGDYAFPTIACGVEEQRKKRHREEEEWLLGGGGRNGKGKGRSTGTKERRKRVEGWLERARGLVGRDGDDEEGEGTARSDEGVVEVRGKKRRPAAGSRKGSTSAGTSDSGATRKKKKKGGESSDTAASRAKDDDAERRKKSSVWGAWGESFSKSTSSKLAEQGDGGDDSHQDKSADGDEADESLATTQGDEGEDDDDAAGAVDLIVSDPRAEERKRDTDRRRGDPALRAHGYGHGAGDRVFRRIWKGDEVEGSQTGKAAAQQNGGEVPPQRTGDRDAPSRSHSSSSSSSSTPAEAAAPPPTHRAGADVMEGQLSTEVKPPGEESSSSSSRDDDKIQDDDDDRVSTTVEVEDATDSAASAAAKVSHMPVYTRHDWRWHAPGEAGGEDGENPWA